MTGTLFPRPPRQDPGQASAPLAGPQQPPEEIIIMQEMLTGKNVLIRTVTNYYTGRLAAAEDGWLQLDDAAWIADTGRFADALATGKLNEVEPYPGTCFVAAGAVVDMAEWPHELPRTQK